MPSFIDDWADVDMGSREKAVRAPFAYHGGKQRSLKHILPHLPYRDAYIEPFGGSGAVLLARNSVPIEVFNDRYAGVVAFYRCIRDPKKIERLIERIDATVHSREEFIWCKENWENFADDVERAACWYYMMIYSFGGHGRNFGRSTTQPKGLIAGRLHKKLTEFRKLHRRLARVQVENQDWSDILRDYDSPNAVFYIDPPYLDTWSAYHGLEFPMSEHLRLLEKIFELQGFVAVSTYVNDVYGKFPWNASHTWNIYSSAHHDAVFDPGTKQFKTTLPRKKHVQEVLHIKEAR
jgi:DNA adenine methylase